MFSQRGERSMLRVTRAETARRPPTSPNAAHDLISRSKVIRPLIDSLVCPSAASGSTDSFLHVRFKDIKLIPEASKTPQIQTSGLHPKRRTRLRVIIDLSSRDDSDSVNEQLRSGSRGVAAAGFAPLTGGRCCIKEFDPVEQTSDRPACTRFRRLEGS